MKKLLSFIILSISTVSLSGGLRPLYRCIGEKARFIQEKAQRDLHRRYRIMRLARRALSPIPYCSPQRVKKGLRLVVGDNVQIGCTLLKPLVWIGNYLSCGLGSMMQAMKTMISSAELFHGISTTPSYRMLMSWIRLSVKMGTAGYAYGQLPGTVCITPQAEMWSIEDSSNFAC